MKFSRTLPPSFITALNNLYEDEKSWWRKIADDHDVFILIRNKGLRVQANGGLLLHIVQDRQQKLTCRMFEEYLSLRSGSPYITLDESSPAPIQRVEGLKGFVEHYEKIKRRISIFTGQEKQVVQYLASNLHNVVDIEIGFEGELEKDAEKRSVPRIDLATINNHGMLIFFEIKLFENSEIRSLNTPPVVTQLKKYKNLLADKREEIIEGYKEQLHIYGQLKGSFFKRRARDNNNLTLYPRVRLVITGFDASQLKNMLPSVRQGIEEKLEQEGGNRDLIAVGDHKNLAKSNRLFLGIK